jgi:hypothetical protein
MITGSFYLGKYENFKLKKETNFCIILYTIYASYVFETTIDSKFILLNYIFFGRFLYSYFVTINDFFYLYFLVISDSGLFENHFSKNQL